jgi:hypothetical protein
VGTVDPHGLIRCARRGGRSGLYGVGELLQDVPLPRGGVRETRCRLADLGPATANGMGLLPASSSPLRPECSPTEQRGGLLNQAIERFDGSQEPLLVVRERRKGPGDALGHT